MLTTDQVQSLRLSLASVCTTLQTAKGTVAKEARITRQAIALDLHTEGESVESLRALMGVKNVSSVHDMLRAERARRAQIDARRTLPAPRTDAEVAVFGPGPLGHSPTPELAAKVEAERVRLAEQRERRHAQRKAEQEAQLQAAAARTPEQLRAEAIDPEGLVGAPTYEARERNEAKKSVGRHDERCPLCSSPLKDNDVQTSGAWVRMSTDGFLVPIKLTAEEETAWEASGYDMGCYVVGSGCARRVPAAYKEKVTAR